MPPTLMWRPSPRSASATDSLRTVSVVMSACAARWPASAPGASSSTSFGMPASTGAIGIGMPMRPVEHTSTSVAATPRPSAASSHMRSASARPVSPVAALALPELSTTAAARPSARWRRLICTGAAVARLVVKTPAALTGARFAVATSDRSGAPEALMPQAIPAASNPSTAVTLMLHPPGPGGPSRSGSSFPLPALGPSRSGSWPESGGRETGGLGQAEHEVRGLDRLARRALHEVVDGAHREHGPGAVVVAHGDVARVRAQSGLGRRRRVDHVHEVVVGVVGARDLEQAR